MKILELRFENLNSLSGKWFIDFTTAEYVSNGIFAITGPTGAGKSTILDAISLALYGRTPRLKAVNKSSNEIMSHQCGSCSAEVVFETSSGRFCVNWSQRRARKSPSGELQQPKHEISDAISGVVLESKLRDVALAVEEKTGMDYDRFTRSMLLAQGGFAAFLEASPDDRAPILEKITGSGIYSEISKLVHEKQREHAKELDLLKASISQIPVLGDEDVRRLEKELLEKQQKETLLTKEIKTLHGKIDWSKNIDSLKEELSDIEAQEEKLAKEIELFQPKRILLDKAKKAHTVEICYQRLLAKRSELADRQVQLKKENEKLPDIKRKIKQTKTTLSDANQKVLDAKENLNSQLLVIKEVRILDVNIANKKDTLEDENKKVLAVSKELKELIVLDEKVLKLNGDLNTKQLDLENEVNSKRKLLSNKELSHLRLELEHLEEKRVLEQKIITLEEERAKLVDGIACPLCGAIEHPFAKGVDVKEGETQRQITQLRKRIKSIDACESKIAMIRDGCAKIKDELSVIEIDNAERKVREENLASLKKQKKSVFESYNALCDEREKLYGDKDPDNEQKLLELALEKALASQEKTKEKLDSVNIDASAIAVRIDALNADILAISDEIEKIEPSFLKDCKLVGFNSESEFLLSRLESSQIESLGKQAKKLDDSKTALLATKNDRGERLRVELKKKVTDIPLAKLQEASAQLEESLSELTRDIGAAKQTLSDDKSSKEKIKQKQAEIEAMASQCAKWDALHSLIGSSDGKKYRNFAQGLTFELMVVYANNQLKNMTERYLLVRDAKEPLELNVIDNYQASEERSTKNLSGGESFIVSLALALGLSNMSSKEIRVDSLFLDEGFGTLDEDALEMALETLSSLEQDGKLIGIISHVKAIKDRIATQINISPNISGRSTLSGAGCAKIG